MALVVVAKADRRDEVRPLLAEKLTFRIALDQLDCPRLKKHYPQKQVDLAPWRRDDDVELVGGTGAAGPQRSLLGGDRGADADPQRNQQHEGDGDNGVPPGHCPDQRQGVDHVALAALASLRRPCWRNNLTSAFATMSGS